MQGQPIRQYHVFLASPGDVQAERAAVRAYFEGLNRTAAAAWGVRFQVVDWENYATAGVGRPQELITSQTLERFRDSLALVVVLMAQRFGTPSGAAESGTEEEVRWALTAHAKTGFPEVKFFFRDIRQFTAPADPQLLTEAVDQWSRVQAFRDEIDRDHVALVRTYEDAELFPTVLRRDLDAWFHTPDRPWATSRAEAQPVSAGRAGPPPEYYADLRDRFQWLDIAGIDSDRAFKLPLNEIYVQLRVISGGSGEGDPADGEPVVIGIQEGLERYPRLVIVGDPGSGKSTFLRYIALTLSTCFSTGDPTPAVERLSLEPPLPIPIFLSCWDLSEHLQKQQRANVESVLDFVGSRLAEAGWDVDTAGLREILAGEDVVFLIDGLDEVPTENGRHLVASLIEDLVGKFPRNRYVVTSRVRAYSGDTVLGRDFARCDVQPFGVEERDAFLRNWVTQLFRTRGDADPGAGEAAELRSLKEAIEASSIQDLAVNPLLLTVIAIVHWNRKRLPEQRVDLYDECVDVLLGQRKDAEQQRAARDPRSLVEELADKRVDERAWVRKRFAEIAFAILERSDEELDRAAVVRLLEPHFEADDPHHRRALVDRFLDRQELRSGLLVSRRSASYRFVHLTFQEYLAAWHLGSRDLATTLETVYPHLREPKWFETLQLLGGVLANRSDEDLDRYVAGLLDRAGETIDEQAPVVALCANVVRDTQVVAGLTAETRRRYEELLRQTLAAFDPKSRVAKQTQLDLLEALGALGAKVKDHLMSATRSALLDVRRRALELLVPHLSDDDLFSLGHLLSDRSKEPIKTYVTALVERDRTRAGRSILDLSLHGEKTLEALLELNVWPKLPPTGIASWADLLDRVGRRGGNRFAWVQAWEDRREETFELLRRLGEAGSTPALRLLEAWGDRDETWDAVRRSAEAGFDEAVQLAVGLWPDRDETWDMVRRSAEAGSDLAARLLVQRWPGREETWETLLKLAEAGSARAAGLLAEGWPDRAETWEVIRRSAEAGADHAVALVVRRWPDRADTWAMIRVAAEAGSTSAVSLLLERWPDRADTWATVRAAAEAGNDHAVRLVAERWPDGDDTWETFRKAAEAGSGQAAWTLIWQWADRDETWQTLRHATETGAAEFAWVLVEGWPDREEAWDAVRTAAALGSSEALRLLLWRQRDQEETWETVRKAAEAGSDDAVSSLVKWWPEREETWKAVRAAAEVGSVDAVWLLAGRWPEFDETWVLLRRLAEDGSVEARAIVAWRDWMDATAASN